MSATPPSLTRDSERTLRPRVVRVAQKSVPKRIAANFAALSIAEILCRGASVAVTLDLAKRLDTEGYGRVEFAFNIVFWLVLLVRDGFDVIAAREIARHPRLVRPLVNHVLAIRLVLATTLFLGVLTIGALTLSQSTDRAVLWLYGLMLLTTASGLDFVYRGLERMGLVAISLTIRTGVYALGIFLLVTDSSRTTWVPACLVFGEVVGIGLVWICYTRRYGLPCPDLRWGRFARVFFNRGRSVYLIQVSQAVIGSMDLLIVGVMSGWADVGLYSAPHRMVSAVLTFGLIFQQVVFPFLARAWRESADETRRALDALVRILMMGMVPIAVGTMVLAGPIVQMLFKPSFAPAAILLSIGIWRAPLLMLAFLYQTTLISLNREKAGVRLLLTGALGSGPIIAFFRWQFGLPGAVSSVVFIGFMLAYTGYARLSIEDRQPSWHHHLAKPLFASLAMVPVCLALVHIHVLMAVAAGGLSYGIVLLAVGGIRRQDLKMLVGGGDGVRDFGYSRSRKSATS
jgi:O-antigen/teichoic acid export membrane protein